MFGSGSKSKTSNSFGSSGKGGSASLGVSKTSSSGGNAKTASFIPLVSGDKGKSEKKSTVPLLLGGKSASAFASNPSKNYPSTSFSNPKKSSTSFGIIWIPGRKHNKKKEYVHVSHRDDGHQGRSPSMYPHEFSMSGDSPNHHPFKKKEEESNLLVLEKPKGPIATAASAGAAVVSLEDKALQVQDNIDPNNPEEKRDKNNPELDKYDKEESKEAAGDANYIDDKDNKSFLGNESDTSKFPDTKSEKDRGDKVDSVYLRPPPSHKVRSNTSTADEEDCGIKCLYYTLQCCDCVLM